MFISSILYPPENLTAAPRAIPCPEVSGAEVGRTITMMSDHDEDTDAAGETDLLVAHYDASEHLHCYTPDTGHWALLAELPQGAGVEYAAITGDTETLYLL